MEYLRSAGRMLATNDRLFARGTGQLSQHMAYHIVVGADVLQEDFIDVATNSN
jgi:hypothetical protein